MELPRWRAGHFRWDIARVVLIHLLVVGTPARRPLIGKDDPFVTKGDDTARAVPAPTTGPSMTRFWTVTSSPLMVRPASGPCTLSRASASASTSEPPHPPQ